VHPEYKVTEADAVAAGLGSSWVGFGFGSSLRNIWTQGAFLRSTKLKEEVIEQRKAALGAFGFDWSGERKFGFVVSALRWHQQEYGHMDVLQECVLGPEELKKAGMPTHLEEYNLGRTVDSIRSGGTYGREEWVCQLNEMRFVWDSSEHKFQTMVLPALAWHQQEYGHMDVRMDCVLGPEELREAGMSAHLEAYNLGFTVSSIRSQGDYGGEEMVKQLNEMRFVWDSLEHRFQTMVVPALAWHQQEYGHMDVRRDCVLGPEELREAGMSAHLEAYNLGRTVNNIRSGGEYGEEEMVKQLNEMRFVWGSVEHKFQTMVVPALAWHQKEYGHMDVRADCVLGPEELREAGMSSHLEAYKLGVTVSNIRSRGDYGNEETVKQLNEMCFVWVSPRARGGTPSQV
jgi:hypothetical protein